MVGNIERYGGVMVGFAFLVEMSFIYMIILQLKLFGHYFFPLLNTRCCEEATETGARQC